MGRSFNYDIALASLKEGEYQYSYVVEDSFFDNFENSPVKSGTFEVDLLLVKKSNHLELDFEISGTENTVCDRCLADIKLPVYGHEPLIVKYDDEEREVDEVVFISYKTASLDISKFIYEFICLQVPMIKLYDCENDLEPSCNQDILNKLNNTFDTKEEEEDDKPSNPFAEKLKNLKL